MKYFQECKSKDNNLYHFHILVETLVLKNICKFKMNKGKPSDKLCLIKAHFPQQTGPEETIPAWGND